MRPEIILVGGGGHCKSCIDVIHLDDNYKIAGIVELKEKRHHTTLGYKVIASDEDLPELARKYENFLVTIGQIETANKRIDIYNKLKDLGVKLPVIISPLAYVAPKTLIGDGTIVMHHAILNVHSSLGENCIVNTRALIEHDAFISDHCHIATGAFVNGGARVGRGTFVGSSTTIRESVEIGAKCVVGAGSVARDEESQECSAVWRDDR